MHFVFASLAAIAVAAAAPAADTATSQMTASGQQSNSNFKKPTNQLLWLKPQAGQKTCPTGTALAVETDSTGKHIGEPKCVTKPVNNSMSQH